MVRLNNRNKLTITIIYFSIFWTGWITNSLAGTLQPTDKQIEIVQRSIHYVFSDSFQQAYKLTESFEDSTHGAPLATMLTAAILLAEMTDDEDYERKDEFFDAVNSATKTLNKYIKNNPDDPWGYFFLGSAYGHKAVWYGLQKSWLKALINGIKAKNRFADAVKIDPHLYDAYTGIGNYHYWSSLRLRKYLPFLPNNKERGLSELELALDSSQFSLYPAMGGLSWAYIYDRKLNSALKTGKELYKKTNGGRISLWILGGTYWRNGNLRMAEKNYTELIDSLNRKGNQNNYNLIFCHYRRGVARFYRGRYNEAYDDLIKIGSFDVSKKVRDRHKKTYKKTKEYLVKIESKLESMENKNR
jgi:hypothetical protein